MPRNAKTVLGWTPLPATHEAPAPVPPAPVPPEPAAPPVVAPPTTKIYPRRAQAQRAQEPSRPLSPPPLDREPSPLPQPLPQPPRYQDPAVATSRPRSRSATREPLALRDPYSQEVFVYTRSGGAATATLPDLPLAGDSIVMIGVSKGVRLLRFTLISSVILMVAYMVYLLLYTPY